MTETVHFERVGEECDAWIAYDVSVVAKAYDERESAKYAFETYIHDDDDGVSL